MADTDDNGASTPRARPEFDAVQWEILLHACPTPLDGNTGVHGAPDEVAAFEQGIKDRLSLGDEWAWCFIVVVARHGNHNGIATLSEGIYTDRDEFMQSPEYGQLREKAYAHLMKNIGRDKGVH